MRFKKNHEQIMNLYKNMIKWVNQSLEKDVRRNCINLMISPQIRALILEEAKYIYSILTAILWVLVFVRKSI